MENQDLKTRVEDLEFKLAQISDAYYKYNFQGSQAITKDTTVQSGLLQSGNFLTGSSGWRIQSNGDAEFNNGTFRGTLRADTLILGASRTVTVTPTDDIQAEIDALNALGGGTIRFSAGTYTLPDLTSYTDISFEGDVMSDTIWDFNNTSNNLTIAGTNIYNTGTITSITSGVNVTGSGTSWLANAHGGQYIFLGTRWYLIAAVTSDTTLILAEGYSDDLTMPGLAYRIGDPAFNIKISGLTIKNSTGTAVAITDARNVFFENITFLDNGLGYSLENVSHTNKISIVSVSNTTHGASLTNCGLINEQYVAYASNGSHGILANNVKTFSSLFCSSSGNALDGYNCTNVKDSIFKVEASGNQSNGIEFVSGCDNNFINDALVRNNASDGIKLTATSDNNTIGSSINIIGNGGYGINIAASTCTTNTLISPFYASNGSGTYVDSGTGTIIINGSSEMNVVVGSTTGTALSTTASTETTITHNLGVAPKLIRVIATRRGITGNNRDSLSIGVAKVTNGTIDVQQVSVTSNNSTSEASVASGIAIFTSSDSGGTGTLSDVTTTTFKITFGATGFGTYQPGGTITYQWEVYA